MKTKIIGLEESARGFSSDFSRVAGQRELLTLVLDAVQAADARALALEANPPGFRPQMMLTLLTYAYASSIYGSRDLELAMQTDRTIRYICARTFPDWQSIRRFRRRHRELVERCLTQVMAQARTLRLEETESEYPWLGTPGPAAKAEKELMGKAAAAARERLDTAALMDGADSD